MNDIFIILVEVSSFSSQTSLSCVIFDHLGSPTWSDRHTTFEAFDFHVFTLVMASNPTNIKYLKYTQT